MTNPSRDRILARIAKEVLRIPTLTTQKSSADFHEVSVWELLRALELAFTVGQHLPTNTRQPPVQEAMSPSGFFEHLAALKDHAGDAPDIQSGICRHCGRDYVGEAALEGSDCPSDDCPGARGKRIVAVAKAGAQ
jgi:hypothetical protein